MSLSDIIIIIIIIVVVTVLVGINVNSVVDKKLSNVVVNIPPIDIPNPQVTVKIQKSCGSEEYDVFIEKTNKEHTKQSVSLSPINEHFTENKTPNTTNDKMIKINPIINNDPKDIKHVQFPDEKDIVEYNDKQKIISEEEKQQQKTKIPQCQNNSLDKQRINAYHYLTENSKGISDYKFPICDDYQKSNNNLNDEEIELLDHYRKKQVYVRATLEDPVVRGYNVGSYENTATLSAIGKIPLTNNFQPKPLGYVFESSPTYNR